MLCDILLSTIEHVFEYEKTDDKSLLVLTYEKLKGCSRND